MILAKNVRAIEPAPTCVRRELIGTVIQAGTARIAVLGPIPPFATLTITTSDPVPIDFAPDNAGMLQLLGPFPGNIKRLRHFRDKQSDRRIEEYRLITLTVGCVNELMSDQV